MIRNFDIDMCDNESCKDNSNRGFFLLETFYIANFIERFFRRNKQHKELYKDMDKKNKITHLVISIEHKSEDMIPHKHSKILIYKAADEYKRIAPLRGKKRAEKILDIVSKSANAFEMFIPEVKDVLEEAIDSFKQAGCKNIWIHQKKRVKGVGTVFLVCELSQMTFTLSLNIERSGGAFYKKKLIELRPDPLLYYNKFKDLIIDNDNKMIMVTDRILNKPFFIITFDAAINGENGTFLNPDQELRDNDEAYTKRVEKNKVEPRWWSDFKQCIQEPEGVPCPRFDNNN